MHKNFIFILTAAFCFAGLQLAAQTDSTLNNNKSGNIVNVITGKQIPTDTAHPGNNKIQIASTKSDTAAKKKHDPRKATLRSAILPGWGQAYNREYWKIPIVYGALAIPGSLFVYNNKWYQKTKEAYTILVTGGDTLAIDPKLKGLTAPDLQYYRNYFRKSRDYSVLFFLLVWGLNVADATVFGHLKNFDVSNDLSMHVQPDFNMATKTPTIGFVFNYKDSKKKMLPSSF